VLCGSKLTAEAWNEIHRIYITLYDLSFRAMCHYLTEWRVSTCAMCIGELKIVGTSQYVVFQVQKLFLKTGLLKIMDGHLSMYQTETSVNMHVLHHNVIN
jgi:succinate-acetate transporter protein